MLLTKDKLKNRTYLIDRSATIFKKEIWNFPISKDNTTSDRETLIKSHLRYCYWLASYFCPAHIPLSEYIAESNLGLVEEANKATTEARKRNFSNLVKHRVASKLYKSKWNTASPLSVSTHYLRLHHQIVKSIETLKKEYETENICSLDVFNLIDSVQASDLFDVINPFFGIMSLDTKNKDDESFLQEVIPGMDLRDETLENYQDLKEKLLVVLHKTLSNLEFVIITEAFGLLRSEPKTIAEITGILGISLKQVYTGYNTGIAKLKNKEVQEMLVTIQNMDISRYTNFEEINRQFEKKYFETLKKNFGENYQNKSLKGFEPHEIVWLKENYKVLSIENCLKYINDRRTDNRQISRDHFRRLVSLLNLTSQKTWTEEEENLVSNYYGRIPDQELADLLTKQNLAGKTFTPGMIVKKAFRMKITKKEVA
jgi:DNA-directed RNA polymerase sigma subunit (sigma70/sigma32)